jgi:stress-induced-phosphoprotein 1
LQAGKTTEAIEHYSAAIRLDGSNHVYYSNRSAAYLSHKDAQNALEDANACIGLNPDFAKGYSRKGAALHALRRYNDAMDAYQQGLAKFPNDAGLQKGLADVQRDKDPPPMNSGGLFGPQMMAQMALNPKLRPYLNDADIMAKIKLMQTNSNMLPVLLKDPKMMEILTILMGGAGGPDGDDDEPDNFAARSKPPAAAAAPAPAAKEPEPMEVEPPVDLSELSPTERAQKEKEIAAKAKKEEGNALYKDKKFAEALAAYDEALALDPTNMTYLSNKAAVFFTQKKYTECVEACVAAAELGKEHRAAFEDRAKVYTRAARAYQKLGDLGQAIEMCNKAQLESYDAATQRLLKTMELEKRQADALAYQDDAKAEEAKQRGNDLFREQKYGEAVYQYEEAVKRAPKNAVLRNNLAAALCKVMDFNGASHQIKTALDIDPKYVKAWARKGDIEMYMKENHKAIESYKKGLALDPDNAACKEGLQKCVSAINYGRSNMSDDEKKEMAAHAMADPEIQSILTDPVMQQVLRDFQENPQAAQTAMRDPSVRTKIEKLIASGIIETS